MAAASFREPELAAKHFASSCSDLVSLRRAERPGLTCIDAVLLQRALDLGPQEVAARSLLRGLPGVRAIDFIEHVANLVQRSVRQLVEVPIGGVHQEAPIVVDGLGPLAALAPCVPRAVLTEVLKHHGVRVVERVDDDDGAVHRV